MAKLTIIVGIAGSGKSVLRKEIARDRGIKGFGDATLTNDDDRRRAGFGCLGELVARLKGGEDCVMDESHLTMRGFRDLFEKFCKDFLPEVEQEWIFFENDALACINNIYHDMCVEVKERELLSRLEALRNQSKGYEIPPPGRYPGHQSPLPVYKQASPRFTDAWEARRWLDEEIERLKHERRKS